MTDEPNQPIDEASATPAGAAADAEVGGPEGVPSAPSAEEAPIEPQAAEEPAREVPQEEQAAASEPTESTAPTEAGGLPVEAGVQVDVAMQVEPEVARASDEPGVSEARVEAEQTAGTSVVSAEVPEAPAETSLEPVATETPVEMEFAETSAPPGASEPAAEPEVSEPPAELEAGEAISEPAAAEPVADATAAEVSGTTEDSGAAEASVVQPASAASGAESAPVEAEEAPKSENMNWYILKVQSNREDSIREGLLRRVKIAGLESFFGQVIVPTEQVSEFKGGKKRVMTRKLYPGYLVVQMEINDDTWFLVRETPGIGDFTGAAGHPTPMLPHEVSRILAKHDEKGEEAPKLRIAFRAGDQVKINEGTFENFEGEVHAIDQANGRVTVMINIFGRSTPVELEYWQIESV